jgi:hypothetical protein
MTFFGGARHLGLPALVGFSGTLGVVCGLVVRRLVKKVDA